MSEITVVGVVVNPKLKAPVLVVVDDDHEVEIWSLARRGQRIGVGYYERGDPQYLGPSYVTGLPRSHTPGGVSPKGKGFGTTLYTGLCLAAHQNAEDEIDLSLDYDGDGISSDAETRSASASAWWSRAVRLGLATEVEDEHTEEDVEFDSGDLSDCEDYDGRSVEVTYARGDVTRIISANAYYYDDADKADLVVASFSVEMGRDVFQDTEWVEKNKAIRYLSSGALRTIWKKMSKNSNRIFEVDTKALLALDVRNLEPQALNLLSTLAVDGGADDADITNMRTRAELDLDPSTPIKQMRLPFTPNQSEAKIIRDILVETKERRAELDWSRLSSLP